MTQNELIESEKMAGLGSLVAGIAHEINTPIGIGVTAVTHLESISEEIIQIYRMGKIKKSELEGFFEVLSESCKMILNNLGRASELIMSFKEVAIDQASESKRRFNLKQYMEEILLSLKPKYKKTKHRILLDCPAHLELNSYPGAFSQIITNFLMNSLIHGFEGIDEGIVKIDINRENEIIVLKYSDNGKGIERREVNKVFDPFYTTKRGKGGTGLGLNVVYNLVYQKIGGTMECKSKAGEGTSFTIRIPINKID